MENISVPYLMYPLKLELIRDKKLVKASEKLAGIVPMTTGQKIMYVCKPAFYPGATPEKAAEKAVSKGFSGEAAAASAMTYRQHMACLAVNAFTGQVDAHLTILLRAQRGFSDHLGQVARGKLYSAPYEGKGVNTEAATALLEAVGWDQVVQAAEKLLIKPENSKNVRAGRVSATDLLEFLLAGTDEDADES